ncbi:hypothetical protein CKO44_10005 [Rubrivivax gelatinosus]|nr:hypothetical protein [Rubrivivax gelatinosus]
MLLAATAWSAQGAAYDTSEYGQMLRALDEPNGRSFFGGPMVDNVTRAWKAAQPLEVIEVPVAPSTDRSRLLRRFVSAGHPIPAAALKAMSFDPDRSAPSGPRAWQVYWSLTHVQPINGASPRHMFSTAQRRFVQCAAAKVVEAGSLYFVSLDTRGDPYGADLEFNKPGVWSNEAVARDADVAAEVRAVCGPVLSAAEGDEEGRRQLDQLLTPPAPSAAETALQAQGLLAAPPQAASAEAAASAPEGTPFGNTKARIRLFQQNGLEGGLTDEAACSSRGSTKAAGGGFWNALASTLHVASSTSIGMPETETTRHLSDRSRAGSKAYFFEREVTAWAPVTVDYGFGSAATGASCATIHASFVPEAGADYEARMDVGRAFCRLIVSRILPGGDLLPVAVRRAASSCPPEEKQ